MRLPTLFALLLLAGCGQMGPLYFDEDPPADQLPPAGTGGSLAPLPAAVPVAPAPSAPDVAEPATAVPTGDVPAEESP